MGDKSATSPVQGDSDHVTLDHQGSRKRSADGDAEIEKDYHPASQHLRSKRKLENPPTTTAMPERSLAMPVIPSSVSAATLGYGGFHPAMMGQPAAMGMQSQYMMMLQLQYQAMQQLSQSQQLQAQPYCDPTSAIAAAAISALQQQQYQLQQLQQQGQAQAMQEQRPAPPKPKPKRARRQGELPSGDVPFQ